MVRLVRLVRNGEEAQWHVALPLPIALDRGELGRLVFQDAEPVQVADEDLDGHHDGREPHRHREREPRARELGLGRVVRMAQQHPGRHAPDRKGGRQEAAEHHVHVADREGRVEDDLPPICRQRDPVLDPEPGRGLHPGVGGQDPEGGDQRAYRDHAGGEEVQPVADPVPAEQHDAEEAGLQAEGRDHLVGDHRPDDVADELGVPGPVRAELVAHHDAGHDAEPERDGEDLHPELVEVLVEVVPVLSHSNSSRASQLASPIVKAGKMMWNAIVNPN
jgi:hypothetical protein